MVTIICGDPRVGKSGLLTCLALKYMIGAEAYSDIWESSQIIRKYNDGGFRFTYPTKHIVYSDYDIRTFGNIHSREADGFKFGLSNGKKKMGFYPPCSRLYFDESQKYYNSRGEFRLPEYVSRAFEIHGHFKYNITLSVQRAKLIDLNIRSLSPKVIEVVELKHKYDHGLIMRSTWTCREYESASDAIKNMEEGGNGKYKVVKYIYDGDIFTHYDSENFRNSFILGHENDDFDYKFNRTYGYSVDEVKKFNDTYSIIANNEKGGDKGVR